MSAIESFKHGPVGESGATFMLLRRSIAEHRAFNDALSAWLPVGGGGAKYGQNEPDRRTGMDFKVGRRRK